MLFWFYKWIQNMHLKINILLYFKAHSIILKYNLWNKQPNSNKMYSMMSKKKCIHNINITKYRNGPLRVNNNFWGQNYEIEVLWGRWRYYFRVLKFYLIFCYAISTKLKTNQEAKSKKDFFRPTLFYMHVWNPLQRIKSLKNGRRDFG